MSKQLLFLVLLLGSLYGYSQEGSSRATQFELRDGLYTAEIGLTTKLSDRWSLHRNFAANYNNDAARFEIPIHFKYQITKKVSVFAGGYGYKVDNHPSYNNIAPLSKMGVGSKIGIEVDFLERMYFKAHYNMNFSMDQNSVLMGLENSRNGGNFKFGYGF